MSFRDVLAYRIACAIWGNSTPIALSPDQSQEGYRIADAVLDLIPSVEAGTCISRTELVRFNPGESRRFAFCTLRAGHAGMHRSSNGTEWTLGSPQSDGGGGSLMRPDVLHCDNITPHHRHVDLEGPDEHYYMCPGIPAPGDITRPTLMLNLNDQSIRRLAEVARAAHLQLIAEQIEAQLPPTGGGVGASPAATAEHRTPSAQADQDERPPTPPPLQQPRMFELYRHRDISGVSGTGTVAWGTQWPDGTASLRWTGAYPAFANWPDIESMLAVHGHQGATELIWLGP